MSSRRPTSTDRADHAVAEPAARGLDARIEELEHRVQATKFRIRGMSCAHRRIMAREALVAAERLLAQLRRKVEPRGRPGR